MSQVFTLYLVVKNEPIPKPATDRQNCEVNRFSVFELR